MKAITKMWIILSIGIIMAYTGCVRTSVSLTRINYEEGLDKKIKAIYLMFIHPDWSIEKKVEDMIIYYFYTRGISVISHIEIVTPTMRDNKEEVIKKIREAIDVYGIDAIMIITEENFHYNKWYIPEHHQSTSGQALIWEDYVFYYENTYSSGGYYIYTPEGKYDIQLFSLEKNGVIWIGKANVRGNRFAGYDDLISALAKNIYKQMKEDGLVSE